MAYLGVQVVCRENGLGGMKDLLQANRKLEDENKHLKMEHALVQPLIKKFKGAADFWAWQCLRPQKSGIGTQS